MSSKQERPNPLEGHARYVKLADLSSGSFGFVVKALNKKNQREYAVKFLPRGQSIQRYVLREILNHRSLRHPHVVQFFEVFLVRDFLAIVMEYADQGDLFSHVQVHTLILFLEMLRLFVRFQERVALSEDFSRWVFQQLIFGLDYCHRKGVANRDIKLENVLLQSGQKWPLVKLCDFGYSKHEDWDSAPRSKVGTPDYMAPEVVCTNGGAYDAKAADVWSCGVVLYVMLVGQYPFSRNEDNDLPDEKRVKAVLQRIIGLDFKTPSHISDSGKDLLKKLLADKLENRATIEQVMRHPWYSKGLPAQALKMNDIYLGSKTERGMQSEEDAIRIVEEAMRREDEPEPNTEDLIEMALGEEESKLTNEDDYDQQQ